LTPLRGADCLHKGDLLFLGNPLPIDIKLLHVGRLASILTKIDRSREINKWDNTYI
jgi:hypothetical protein